MALSPQHPPATVQPDTVRPAKPAKPHEVDATRETVESVVVAFILAFLFRTFEAEAFVIPTGSMAPTLYGQHRDVVCKQCGVRFATGASDELKDGFVDENKRTHTAYCPNCRFPNFVYHQTVFTGDRILVSKFPYDFNDPQPYDVVVFKFPEEPKTNYIKRLIGLPGQEIRLEEGDVLVRKLGATEAPWQILRKAPDKQKDLQILVYDDDHPPRELLNAGWSERWQRETGAQWKRPDDGTRSIRVDPDPKNPGQPQWLRYQHVLPDSDAWEMVRAGKKVLNSPAPLLITDFCGYNASVTVWQAGDGERGRRRIPTATDPYPALAVSGGGEDQTGVLWVPDLTVSCQVEILSDDGQLAWELVEGQRSYRAHWDIAKGEVAFSSFVHEPGKPVREVSLGKPTAVAGGQGRGTHQVVFANVDDRLCLWIDEQLVKSFEFNLEAQDDDLKPIRKPRPTIRDLSPVGIAGINASAVVSHLKLERDVYYRPVHPHNPHQSDPAVKIPSDITNAPPPREQKNLFPLRTPDELATLSEKLTNNQKAEYAIRATLANPERWNARFDKYFEDLDRVFPLVDSENDAEDEFLVLGDNSPRSSDSRFFHDLGLGGNRHAVPRRLLIGKAFFIYWPHAVPFLNGGKGFPVTHHAQDRPLNPRIAPPPVPSINLPWYPQFGRMTRIR